MFLFWFPHTFAFSPVFKCLSFYISEFTLVSICFTHKFQSFAIPPSQCASAGSAERSTNILLVAWPAHNLLIVWPALPHKRFYSVFSHTIAISPVFQGLSLHMFELAIAFTCLFPCFHSFTIFPSECAPTWLTRAIHQHTFSCLAGTQFTDCMTCLTSQTFLFHFPHTIAFLPFFQCFSLHMFELVFVFTYLTLCFH